MERSELIYGLRIFRVGVRVVLLAGLASLVYLVATPDGSNRPELFALSGLILVGALIVARLPQERIIEAGRAGLLWGAWNGINVLGITAAALLDGSDTPYVGLFWLSVAFSAISLTRRFVIVLTLANVAALTLVSVAAADASTISIAAISLRAAALVATAAVCRTLAGDRLRQVQTLQRQSREVVKRLARVVEYRDHDTGGHIERIGCYAAVVADELGLRPTVRDELRLAATLHDVGKVGIPDEILLKPGRLTADERRVMERHAQIGFDMLTGSGIHVLDLAAEIALTHHERFDGSGYPNGLAGDTIPLAGRIVAVADVFDAITSDRVYKDAMSVETAMTILEDGRGSHFDPRVLDAFLRRCDDIVAVRARREDVAPADAVLSAA